MIAAILPFALTLSAKAKVFTLRDNHETRAWQGRLTGWRQRAHWAQLNAFESFPIFAAAAIVAYLAAPTSTTTTVAAWAYPATRVAYSFAFVADLASLRSLVWFASMACIVVLFLVGLGTIR
jgi:uncharacterized MAPEG superfamily protein